MELSFDGISSADAGQLAQELELALIRAGAPQDALSLKRTSSENMDLGTVLGVSVELILHTIGGAGYIACFGKCIYEIVAKHNVTISVSTANGEFKISGPEGNMEMIASALAASTKAKPKAKSKV